MSATVIPMPPPKPAYGATPADWTHFSLLLGLGADLLPVVSNPHAPISEQSRVSDLGKVPTRYNSAHEVVGIAGWTKTHATDRDIASWARQADYGICLQTRDVRALDIDVADAGAAMAVVEFVNDFLGFTLPRRLRANSGKCLLAFRVEGEFSKRTVHIAGGMVENLNNGQQFIAVGTHPSGARYEWAGGLPEDFPTLTPERYEALWLALVERFAIASPSESRASVRSEKIAYAHQSDPVAQLLFDKSLVRSTHTDGRLFIQCPFEAEHTTPSDERDTATAYWPAHTGGYVNGHFHCLHAHCERRSDDDFHLAIGYQPELESFDALVDDTPAPEHDFDVLPDDGTASVDAACTPSSPAAGEPKEPLKFPVETLDAFANHPPQKWVIKNVLPQAGLAVLYGESGSGKSFLTLDMSAAIARGQPWRGHKVRQGKVVYVVAEGAGGFRNRIQAYARQHEIGIADVPLGVINAAPNLIERKDAVALAKSILHSGGADVIVIDTLAQTTPGANENSGEDMGLVLNHCREIHRVTGALVLLVHHSGKDATKGARGWSGLRAAADVEIEVTRGESVRTARVSKQKDGEDGGHWNFVLDTVTLGLDEDDDPITSCVINFEVPQELPGAVKAGKGPVGSWQHLVMAVVQEFGQAQSTGIERKAVVDECDRRSDQTDPRRRDKIGKAIKALAEKECFDIDEDDCISIGGEL